MNKKCINIAGNVLLYSEKKSIIATLDDLHKMTPDKWNIHNWCSPVIFPSTIIYNEISSSSKYHTGITHSNIIYVSNDYGATFLIQMLDYSNLGCCDIAISNNEQYQVIITNKNSDNCSFIYVSTDYGMNWDIKYCNINGKKCCEDQREITMQKVSISETGKYIVICGENTLLYSHNFGEEWNTVNLNKQFNYLLSNYFSCVKISTNGQYQTVCSIAGDIYVSTNYGMFWNLVKVGETLQTTFTFLYNYKISHSYSGQYQIIVHEKFIWYSYNYGASWNKIFENLLSNKTKWINGVLSSDGKYIFVINDNAEIYYSYNLVNPTQFTWHEKIQNIFITNFFIYILTSDTYLYKCPDKLDLRV